MLIFYYLQCNGLTGMQHEHKTVYTAMDVSATVIPYGTTSPGAAFRRMK